MKPVLFDTAQAAALAGYLAAGASKTGIVGTYGGMPFPSVTVFMDGFEIGVNEYNEAHGTDRCSWSAGARPSRTASSLGSFDDQLAAKTITEGLLDQNVDVIMPVAGLLYQASIEAIRDRGSDTAIIGVNSDAFITAPEYGEFLLTSVLKNLTVAAEVVTTAAGEGEFDNTPDIGTLENDGVGIAPTDDWESKLDPALLDEVEQLEGRHHLGRLQGGFAVVAEELSTQGREAPGSEGRRGSPACSWMPVTGGQGRVGVLPSGLRRPAALRDDDRRRADPGRHTARFGRGGRALRCRRRSRHRDHRAGKWGAR